MSIATITSKGQTTIPIDIREYLQLKPGDQVDFVKNEEGKVMMIPRNQDLLSLQSILPPTNIKATLEEIKEAIRRRGSGYEGD